MTDQPLDMVGVTGSIPVAPTKEQPLTEPAEKTGQQVASNDLNLVVTLDGRPVRDQGLAIEAFKNECLARARTPQPQAGEWTLIAPDGRKWVGDSPLKCASLEQKDRVPANIALARIMRELYRDKLGPADEEDSKESL